MTEAAESLVLQALDALLPVRDGESSAGFLRRQFDAGLAAVEHPAGLGGLGVSKHLQRVVDERLQSAGAPTNDPASININLGQTIPGLIAHGTDEQRARLLRPLWTGEVVACQLFSEPEAGSDLSNVATRAVPDGDGWRVTGHKVWTSLAHKADLGILLARTDLSVARHRGLTFFLIDMRQPGVEIRPLRQMTGEAEFNEVFMDGAHVSDADRLGDVGDGWAVAMSVLAAERLAYEARPAPRGSGPIAPVLEAWRSSPARTSEQRSAVIEAWILAESVRIANERIRQQAAAGRPGPEGSASKLTFAQVHQRLATLTLELGGIEAMRGVDYTFSRPLRTEFVRSSAALGYLRSRATSIEGGTSEIMRRIIAERVLGLPKSVVVDRDQAWSAR